MKTLPKLVTLPKMVALAALAVVCCGATYAQRSDSSIREAAFVKTKSGWVLRLALGSHELLDLAKAAAKNGPAFAQVSLTPGKWVSGRIHAAGEVEVTLLEADLAGITPGWNEVKLRCPGWREISAYVDAETLLRAEPDFRAYAEARLHVLDLTPGATQPVNAGLPPEKDLLRTEDWPGLAFAAPSEQSVAKLGLLGKPEFFKLERKARSLYVLAGISQRARSLQRVTVTLTAILRDGGRVSRTFDRLGNSSWTAAPRGASNEKRGWCVLQIDLGETKMVDSLAIDVDARIEDVAIAGITVLGGLQPGKLATLPPRIQSLAPNEPTALFAFDQPGLPGWEIKGSGWGTTDTRGEIFMRKGASLYFADSKVVGGEPAIGTILSPPFIARGSKLTFLANGHGEKNYYLLVDAATGAELRKAPVPEKTGPFVKITWDLAGLQGRRVRFVAVDNDNRDAYAWLAFDEVVLEP